jgi:hypothetical protein
MPRRREFPLLQVTPKIISVLSWKRITARGTGSSIGALIEEIGFATDSALEEADLPPMIKRKKAGQ